MAVVRSVISSAVDGPSRCGAFPPRSFVPSARALLWIPSFAIMGIACVVNARGCGRLHCFVTGPLFLVAAFATALDATTIIVVSWKVIFVGAGVGTLVAYSLEWLRGKYVGTSVVP